MARNSNGLPAMMRAGREIIGALAARTGPRPHRRLSIAVAGALGLGLAGGAAAMAVAKPDSDMSGAERARIEAVVRDYILAHPEIIPQAIQKLQERNVAQAVEEHRAELEKPYAGAWEGAADADVVLVEFFDYACGYCRNSAPDLARLLKEDRRLKLVYRELPILSEQSMAAARVGLHAAEEGRYPAFHKAMYDGDGVGKDAVLAAAAKAGLDKAKVQDILSKRASPVEIENNIRLAQALNARGTPLFVVGDQVLEGAVGYEALKAAVEKARAEAKTRG